MFALLNHTVHSLTSISMSFPKTEPIFLLTPVLTGEESCSERELMFGHFGHFFMAKAPEPCTAHLKNSRSSRAEVCRSPAFLADFCFGFSSRSKIWPHFVNIPPKQPVRAKVCKLSPDEFFSGEVLTEWAKCCHTSLAPEQKFERDVYQNRQVIQAPQDESSNCSRGAKA